MFKTLAGPGGPVTCGAPLIFPPAGGLRLPASSFARGFGGQVQTLVALYQILGRLQALFLVILELFWPVM